MKKDFKCELYKFINLLKQKKNFAFVRISDAEGHILRGGNVEFDDYRIGHNWGWKNDDAHFKSRELLLNTSLCEDNNFYIGLPTHGDKTFFDEMKGFTKQKDEFLTFALLFMDTNHQYFITDMYAEFKNWEVIGVFRDGADSNRLDLNVIKTFKIQHSAYVNSLYLIDEIKQYIKENHIKNKLFLITGGPFANILIYKLFKFEKENTYIDIGSALDYKLGLGITKSFLDSTITHKYQYWFE
jgi:hypothetical protein